MRLAALVKTRIELNPSQQKVIDHGEGPALVLSGAGSGKTSVITHRVARLINSGINPKRILCLTFTRKAAREMDERIKKFTAEASKKSFIGTFHAWGLVFMKKYSSWHFPTNKFTLYDESDRKEALISVLREADLDFSGSLLRYYSEQISLAKNNLIMNDDVPEEIRGVYQRYENFLSNRKACDFDDLLTIPCRLLSSNPDLLEKYQNRYDYILVDEYQDTNRVQYRLLQLLGGKKPNIMAVGDDDQSIYSWRGARIENILDFEKDFQGTRIIRLETNYRSSENIIACANSLIINNHNRKDKKLIPIHAAGDKLHVYEALDPYAEAKWVAEMIQSRILKEDCGYGDFAILYRAKHQSKILKEVLIQFRIPYQAYGEIDFFDRKEIRDLIAFAKLLHNPHDDISLFRIINLPRRVRESVLKKISEESGTKEGSIYDFLKDLDNHPMGKDWFKSGEWENLSLLLDLLDRYHDISGKETPKLFKEFLNLIDYQTAMNNQSEKAELRNRREKHLEQFFEIMSRFFNKNTRSSLGGFITQITMEREEETEETSQVSLLTIHAAKGLEFPHVFIIGFEENLMPFCKEDYPVHEEEERRLCYVALTRAQKTCTLTFCKKRKTLGGEISNPPSRFLKEITPDHLIKEYGDKPERPPEATEEEKNIIRKKAIFRIKAMLED